VPIAMTVQTGHESERSPSAGVGSGIGTTVTLCDATLLNDHPDQEIRPSPQGAVVDYWQRADRVCPQFVDVLIDV
jgi:hypothetical protein